IRNLLLRRGSFLGCAAHRTGQSPQAEPRSCFGKPDPAGITFGELGEKFLANYPFNKQSTKELHEQVMTSLLMPKWADSGAINIDPPKLKAWFLRFDVESSTRG